MIPVVQMVFIEVDVDLSYALYFSALVFLIGQETHIVNARLHDMNSLSVSPYDMNQHSMNPAEQG